MTRRSDPRLRSALSPMNPRGALAGRVVTGARLDDMARRVAAAAVQELASRRAYSFLTQIEAPFATINAITTDFEISYTAGGGAVFAVPWMLQTGFDAVELAGVVTIPVEAHGKIAIRVSVRTLITAIATTESPYQILRHGYGPPPPGCWMTGDLAVQLAADQMYSFALSVVPSEVPADNLISLVLEVRSDAESADPGGDVEYVVRLKDMLVSNAITDTEDT